MTERAQLRGAGLRLPVVLASTSAAAGGALVTGLAIMNPFNLAHAGTFGTIGVAVLFLFLGVTFALAPWCVPVRVAAAIAAVGLGAILVPMSVASHVIGGTGRPVASTKAADGSDLVVQRDNWIDEWPVIRLGRGSGPLRQESLVYYGPMYGELPSDVRFAGDHQIAFSVGDRDYTSTYDPWTLEVDPIDCQYDDDC
ncbi:hypothetical protein [Microlunatus speluncae]|uniref:hypothetical protein n=1 Tax=Microlunatus speluncae TaxID=2594267 RepID=UPI0012666A69|nr:hypothetical protein [Microlunatus speluncae]